MRKNDLHRWLPAKEEEKIRRTARALLPSAWEVARLLFDRPEPAYEEFFAADTLSAFLARHGFALRRVGGLPTAFVAEAGHRGPGVAFLAEMDALPDLGHACGHHLIAASSAAAAVVLRQVYRQLPGRIKVIGCPAEERGGGKLELARAGEFAGLAAVIIMHPDERTQVFKRSLGLVEVEVEFSGPSLHPEEEDIRKGNALAALIQTFNAVNLLRQQLPAKVRLHGIITSAGAPPELIPSRAAALFFARGLTDEETLALAQKLVRCARAAAAACGVRLRSRVGQKKRYAPYVPNRTLGAVYAAALARLGIQEDPGAEDEAMGSTDVGEVCRHAAVIHPLLRLPGAKEGVHTRAFARAAAGSGGQRLLAAAITANALTGAAVLRSWRLREEIEKEFRRRKNEGDRSDGRNVSGWH